jgi:hypothetical protein
MHKKCIFKEKLFFQALQNVIYKLATGPIIAAALEVRSEGHAVNQTLGQKLFRTKTRSASSTTATPMAAASAVRSACSR